MSDRLVSIDTSEAAGSQLPVPVQLEILELARGFAVRRQLARVPETLISGTITRDSNGAPTSAAVVWPDGTTGTYTADVVSTAYPGSVDGYHITYGSTLTYTQPTVTRDSSGAVIVTPAIVES